ncbi:MAG: polysaccharide pyruvyl transferase family protein, partial [Candidatus Paraprevotella stercoravium]|nr:polysaccharide pyruvyl transferase family protein [Candidatus Paraprevotella stercoravium]
MTGSDQVWGPTLNGQYDEAYFLSFVTGKPRTAYAASFGRTDFTPQILAEYKKLLSTYSGIAVRENSAVDLLTQMGIPCAGQVLDPTLLLTGEEWSKRIKRNIEGKYVLVYQLHNNPVLTDYALRFARHTGLPLYRISPTFHQIRRGGKFVYLPDLDEFLSYIKNCTYFLTDSFHGTAFALNFNKQFIEILPNNKTGSRNQSILQLTGLTDRILTDFSDFSMADKVIEYTLVNNILAKERQKSIAILKSLLSNR